MNAAARYIASLYEAAIDRQLDVEAIRVRLAARGVLRTPAMVRNDLDNVYQFTGYYASHPAPEEVSRAEFDRQIGY